MNLKTDGVPDGDCRHHPESGLVADRPKRARIHDEHIVAILVLCHHTRREHMRIVPRRLIDGELDGSEGRRHCSNPGIITGRKVCTILDGESHLLLCHSAQTNTPPIATKTAGRNHLSKNRWKVHGSCFTGAFAFAFIFVELLFIGVARLSAGLPLEMNGRFFATTPPH